MGDSWNRPVPDQHHQIGQASLTGQSSHTGQSGPTDQSTQIGQTSQSTQADRAALAVVAALDLQPHPEGGWYRELHRAAGSVQRRGDGAERAGVTLIAYLLQGGERSCWHRVRGSDEIWLHAAGAPLDLWSLPPQGGQPQRLGLGSLTLDTPVPPADQQRCGALNGEIKADATAEGQKRGGGDRAEAADRPVRVIPANWWQAARSRGAWTLVHCVVGPGFAFEDFEILATLPVAQRPDGALEDLL